MESAALAAREAKGGCHPVGVVAAGAGGCREVSVARAVTGHLRTTSAELVEPAVWAAAVVMAEWATVVGGARYFRTAGIHRECSRRAARGAGGTGGPGGTGGGWNRCARAGHLVD